MKRQILALLVAFNYLPDTSYSQNPMNLTLSGPWQVTAEQTALPIAPPNEVTVTAEILPKLPEFNSQASGWSKGAKLPGVQAQECSVRHAADPASVVIRSTDAAAVTYERGKDYEMDPEWGTVGRLPGGRIAADQPVAASYRYVQMRLDSVVRRKDGTIAVVSGTPHVSQPQQPALSAGEERLANIYIPGRLAQLTPDCLFPVLETEFPPVPISRFPEALAKLKRGEPLKILAWGDSVTDGGYLPNKETDRWQSQFVARLRERFPKSKIELITEGWGGRTTSSFLAEPPGALHNYQEKVLATRPDLIISEFVNDANLPMEQLPDQYQRLLHDFREIGAEWIILTPHYVRPDWMSLNKQKEIDEDPRPYVKMLRKFGAEQGVPIADASLRWGRLWRQGIPYLTLHSNNINHPDARGMKLFADSLMELFPE